MYALMLLQEFCEVSAVVAEISRLMQLLDGLFEIVGQDMNRLAFVIVVNESLSTSLAILGLEPAGVASADPQKAGNILFGEVTVHSFFNDHGPFEFFFGQGDLLLAHTVTFSEPLHLGDITE